LERLGHRKKMTLFDKNDKFWHKTCSSSKYLSPGNHPDLAIHVILEPLIVVKCCPTAYID
jgi:hypothetical protein